MQQCEVTATYEFIVELAKFYNVDLFLRGLYTLQIGLKTNQNSKLSTKIEVTTKPLQHSSRSNKDSSSNHSSSSSSNNHHHQKSSSSSSSTVGSAAIQKTNSSTESQSAQQPNFVAKSRTFRILFKNEEIDLNQIVLFRVNINLDIKNLTELTNVLEFKLDLKLLFNDTVVSGREIIVNLYNSVGINYYRPIFFDYFYLCAIGLSVHGGLIALHLTKGLSTSDYYLPFNSPNNNGSSCSSSTSSTPSCVSSSTTSALNRSKLRASQQLLIQILINANTNLRTKLAQLMKKESSCCVKPLTVNNIVTSGAGKKSLGRKYGEDPSSGISSRILILDDDEEEDDWIQSSKQMSQLCAENILVWHRFLDSVIGKEDVRCYLARLHHQARVERFTEGFYITKNPVRASLVPKDYTPIVDLLKKSIIYKPLPLECLELDGDESTIPIIFEDQFVKSVCNCLGGGTATGLPLLEERVRKKSEAETIEDNLMKNYVVGSRLTISKSSNLVATTETITPPKLSNGVSVTSETMIGSCGIIDVVTTLPRRHSEHASSANSKLKSSAHGLVRKYASTPLLNELELDVMSEESGWVSNDEEESGSSSSSLISGDGCCCEDLGVDDETNISDVNQIHIGIPPPAEFRDPPSVNSVAMSANKMVAKNNFETIVRKKFGSLQYPSGSERKYQRKLSVSPPPTKSNDFNLTSSPSAVVPAAAASSITRDKSISAPKQPINLPPSNTSTQLPYYFFQIPDELRIFHPKGLHLIICVHGLDGSSHDLRLFKVYLEVSLPGENIHFLMSEKNQDGETFNTFEQMTTSFTSEILNYIKCNKLNPSRISFVGHSLGNIIIRSALVRPELKHLLPKLHTFLSLSGPHLGTLYNGGIVNVGMWLMQKWKKSTSLLQLSLKDDPNIKKTFLYKLSMDSNLDKFRYVLLCGSTQDRYVPLHSAHILNCKASLKDTSTIGSTYRQMVTNLLTPILKSNTCQLIRYDVHHAIPTHTANSIIGRAAHIAVLDSEIFIEKFLSVSSLKYFQ